MDDDHGRPGRTPAPIVSRADALGAVAWRKAAASNPNGDCVELAALPAGGVAMRHSRAPAGPALVYTRAEIAAFVHGAKAGEFDDLSR